MFEVNNLIEWRENIIDELISVYNSREAPLRQVVRKDCTGYVSDIIGEEETLYHASLHGPIFDQYSEQMMRLIKELNSGTPVEASIKQVKCDRAAMQNLRQHFDENSEGESHKIQASEALKKDHYRHEHAFRFEKYITKLQINFKVLERFDVTLYEEDNKTYLLNKISVDNAKFKTNIAIVRQSSITFNKAYTHLTTQTCSIFLKQEVPYAGAVYT